MKFDAISIRNAFSIVSLILINIVGFSRCLYSQSYDYDSSRRIIQITYADGTIFKYKYDAAGNLKKAKTIPAVMASIAAADFNGASVQFNLQRTGDLTRSLTIGLIAEGDAISGKDYLALPATATFTAHESSTSFSVTLRPDRAAGGEKKLIVSLAEADDYALDKHSSATVILPEKK